MSKDGNKSPDPPTTCAVEGEDGACPSTVREDLATELYTLIRLALDRHGVTPEEHRRARDRANRLNSPPAVSGALLRDARGLGNLLLEWTRAGEYIDRYGRPRVLQVKGTGATFEALIRRFMPTKTIADAIALAQATAEISLRPRGKIALLGSILVKLTNTPENVLAHTIRQLDQLLKTSLHNKQRDEGNTAIEGRMERMVIGVILRDRYPDLMADLRPQIYDLLQRVDSAVEHRQPTTLADLTRSTALSVGIYISQEDDWERAGIDPETIVKTPSKDE